MKELKLGKPTNGNGNPGGEDGFLQVETDEGPCRLVVTDEIAELIIMGLRQLQGAIQTERQKAGKPAFQHRFLAQVERLEFGVDQVQQVVVIRTRFRNAGAQDTPIERAQIPQVVKFLNEAQAGFEAQDKSRRQ